MQTVEERRLDPAQWIPERFITGRPVAHFRIDQEECLDHIAAQLGLSSAAALERSPYAIAETGFQIEIDPRDRF